MMITLVSEEIWEFDLKAALEEISEQRREQVLKFKHEQGQRLCVLAYQLLKQGLREAYGITENPIFEYNEHGKPSIVGHPEIFFNLSHSGDYAVCAFGDNPIGIDIQKIVPYNEKTAKRVCSFEEFEFIQKSCDKAEEFTKLWTKKEAVAKMEGTGISSCGIKTCTGGKRVKTFRFSDYFVSICEKAD